MSHKAFMRRLQESFSQPLIRPLPLDHLSGEELIIAKKINDEIAKASKYQLLVGGSIRIIEKGEYFHEKIVGVISALIRVSALSWSERALDTLCGEMVGIFSKELDFDNCSIMLKDEKGNSLVLIAGSGKGDKYKHSKTGKLGTTIEIGEGVAGKAFSMGKAVFVSDITQDTTFITLDTKVSIMSVLAVPIKVGDNVIGVINFSHPVQHEIYDRKYGKPHGASIGIRRSGYCSIEVL